MFPEGLNVGSSRKKTNILNLEKPVVMFPEVLNGGSSR
jgi:hypothetical protein